jgi:MFS family permease
MRRLPHYVSALLGALQFPQASTQALEKLDECEWRDLLSFSDLMHLTLPLGEACGSALPEWVRARMETNFTDNALHFERVKMVYTEISSALHDAAVEHLVIKGFAQYPGYVDDPRLRLQSDIDLFCPEESIFRARDVLTCLGYEPNHGLAHLPSDHLAPMGRKSNWQWKGNLFDPEMPVGVELHFRFWDETSARFSPTGLDYFWARRVGKQISDLRFLALHSVDNLGYISLHMLRNLLRGEWMIQYAYEIAYFLHASATNETFWQGWLNLHDGPLRSLQAIAFRLSKEWFGCTVAEPVAEEIERMSPSVQQWFAEFAGSPLTGIFDKNKDFLWLHMALLESARERAAVLRRTLLPGRVPPVGAPGQGLNYKGEPKKFWPSQRHAKYAFYIASRVTYHASALPTTLFSGLRWWWGSKGLGKDFWTFYAASFCVGFGGFIFFLLYNLYLVSCGFSEKLVGWVVSATAIGSLAGTIPAGLLANRFGLRKALWLCFSSVPLLWAARVVIVSQTPQLILAFLSGAALSIWAVCISPTLAQLTTEKNRPFAFSLVFSSGIGVGVLGGLVGGILPAWLNKMLPAVSSLHSMQLALWIACAIVALGLIPVSYLRLTSTAARDRKVYPRNPFLLRYLLAIALWSLVTGSLGPFFNIYFSHYLHLPVARIGFIFSAAQLSQVVAILLSPLMYKKFGLVPGIMYMMVATSASLGVLASVPGAAAAAIVYSGYMAFQWMSEPGMYSLLMNEVLPEERSGASALNFFVISLSGAVAAAVAGQGLARFGYPTVIACAAGLALAAAFLFRVLLGNRKTKPAHKNSAVVELESSALETTAT